MRNDFPTFWSLLRELSNNKDNIILECSWKNYGQWSSRDGSNKELFQLFTSCGCPSSVTITKKYGVL